MAAKVSVTWNTRGPLPDRCDAVIIGSGLGGLMCAAKLAAHGLSVCVLESHSLPGGYAHQFRRKGYLFDVSLHHIGGLIGEGEDTREFLTDVGVYQKLEWEARETLMTVDFPDERIVVPNRGARTLEALAARFPAEAEGLRRFVHDMRVLRDSLQTTQPSEEDLRRKAAYRNDLWSDMTDPYIRDPKLLAVFGQMWMYTGLPPKIGSANYWTKVFGSFFIDGSSHIGGGGLASVFCDRIGELGGGVYTNRAVQEIIYKDGRACGVVTKKGDRVLAPIVVSNADPYQTYLKLLPEAATSKAFRFRLTQQERSVSAYAMYCGLDCAPSELGIPDGNYFNVHSPDMEEAYRRCMAHEIDRSDWSMTSYEKVTDAAKGPSAGQAPGKQKRGGSISICEVTPGDDWFGLDDAAYRKRKAEVEATLMAKYSRAFPELEAHTVVREFGTPRTMTRYTENYRGSIYGFSQLPKQSNTLRLANRSPIPGLYLASAWVQPGGGYEGSMLAGLQSARQILEEEAVPTLSRDEVEARVQHRLATKRARQPSKTKPQKEPAPAKPARRSLVDRRVCFQDTDATGYGYNVAYLEMLADARAGLTHMGEARLRLSEIHVSFTGATRLGDRVQASSELHAVEGETALLHEFVDLEGQPIVRGRARLACFSDAGQPTKLDPTTRGLLTELTATPARKLALTPAPVAHGKVFDERTALARPGDFDAEGRLHLKGLLQTCERSRFDALELLMGEDFATTAAAGLTRLYQQHLKIAAWPRIGPKAQLSVLSSAEMVSAHRLRVFQDLRVFPEAQTLASVTTELVCVDRNNQLVPAPASLPDRIESTSAGFQAGASTTGVSR